LITLLTQRDPNFVGGVPHFVRDDRDWALTRRSTFGVERWTFSGRQTLQVTPYIGDASYADAPSYACGACAWQFLLSVFFWESPFRFSGSQVAIQPFNPLHCNSVSLRSWSSLAGFVRLLCSDDHAILQEAMCSVVSEHDGAHEERMRCR